MNTCASPLGVALVGVGMVSPTYVAGLAALREKLVLRGVMARSTSSADAFVHQHADVFAPATLRVYNSAAEIAADPAVDIVIITTPPNARLELLSVLAEAGKPILLEKPLERTYAAAEHLCDICDASGVPLGVVLQHRVRPSAQQLMKLLASQTAGELRAVEIAVPWWREQAYYDEPGRGSYARDGGGVLISQAIHTLDLALQFTGPVSSVTALAATTGFHRMESEDFVSAGVRFANGAVGSLFASTSCFPGRTESIRFYYEEVSILLESSVLRLDWRDGRVEELGVASGSGSGADPMAFTADWHTTVIEDFCAAVVAGSAPPVSARSALPVHGLIAALEASAASGHTVHLADGKPVPDT